MSPVHKLDFREAGEGGEVLSREAKYACLHRYLFFPKKGSGSTGRSSLQSIHRISMINAISRGKISTLHTV